jgi:hypothetical protein
MNQTIEMESIRGELASALRAVERLEQLGENFPALARNAARALASLKMIEINLADLYELGVLAVPDQTTKAVSGARKPVAKSAGRGK